MRAVVFAYSNVGDRCLRVLAAGGVDVSLVVTHRDHPGEARWFSCVADTAAELGLPTIYSDDLGDDALATRVAQARPDVIFSFYYRSMLPPSVLEVATQGAFNMHGSLLPKYRGRAPTNWAVLCGETETGATLHYMVAKADAGDIVDQFAVPILPDDTGQQVFDKVTVAAETILWRSLPAIAAGHPPRRMNDIVRGSYFGGRKPEDGQIDWTRPAAQVYDLIRAVAPPYPGAFTEVAGTHLVIAEARLAGVTEDETSGSDRLGLHVHGERIFARCGDGREIVVHRIHGTAGPMNAAMLTVLLDQAR